MKAVIREGSMGWVIPTGEIWAGYTPTLVDDIPKPTLQKKKHNLLVKVHTAALNPADAKVPKFVLGAVMGMDFCGTVEEKLDDEEDSTSDSSDQNIQVGDVVMGCVPMGYSGSLADYALGSSSKVVKLPSDWTLEEGAAFPVACCTALDGLRRAGVLQVYQANPDQPPIDSILVIGSSGGCGVLALQLAKGMGIPRIIGVCSSKNAQFCIDNGATEIIAYDDDNNEGAMETFLKDNAGKIACIYDAASYSGGAETYSDNPQVLKLLQKDAKYIMLNGSKYDKGRAVTWGLIFSSPKTLVVLPKFTAVKLKLGLQLLQKAKLKPIIDTVYPFTSDGVREGFEKLKSRRARGKIVHSISSPS